MKKNLGSGLLAGALAASQLMAGEPGPSISVRVANSANVAEARLKQGEKLASYILSKAGVSLAWQDCSGGSTARQSSGCASSLGDTEFRIYVDNDRPAPSAAPMLGFTVVNRDPGADVRVAGIYYPMVRNMAASFQVDQSEILGAALAHEIGHLLGVVHAPKGVMIAQFDRDHIVQARRGGLLFSATQASQMRDEIARRRALSTAR